MTEFNKEDKNYVVERLATDLIYYNLQTYDRIKIEKGFEETNEADFFHEKFASIFDEEKDYSVIIPELTIFFIEEYVIKREREENILREDMMACLEGAVNLLNSNADHYSCCVTAEYIYSRVAYHKYKRNFRYKYEYALSAAYIAAYYAPDACLLDTEILYAHIYNMLGSCTEKATFLVSNKLLELMKEL